MCARFSRRSRPRVLAVACPCSPERVCFRRSASSFAIARLRSPERVLVCQSMSAFAGACPRSPDRIRVHRTASAFAAQVLSGPRRVAGVDGEPARQQGRLDRVAAPAEHRAAEGVAVAGAPVLLVPRPDLQPRRQVSARVLYRSMTLSYIERELTHDRFRFVRYVSFVAKVE